MTPGHTHEDIDAIFGILARWLKLVDALTIDDMMKAYVHCIRHRAEQMSIEAAKEDPTKTLAATSTVLVPSVPDFNSIFNKVLLLSHYAPRCTAFLPI